LLNYESTFGWYTACQLHYQDWIWLNTNYFCRRSNSIVCQISFMWCQNFLDSLERTLTWLLFHWWTFGCMHLLKCDF
jgi:hypothetical protein